MHDKKQTFSLFFPEPMDGQDNANLQACGVTRVQMFLGVASDPRQANQLRYLRSKAIQVTLRIEEPAPGREQGSYYHPDSRQGIITRIDYVRALCPVEAVIVGNEPEHPYDLTWKGASWGNTPGGYFWQPGGKAQAHNDSVVAMTALLRPLGLRVITPGWSHKRIRPQQPGQPGRASWRELNLGAYNAADANGVHLYADGWTSVEDTNRLLWAFGEETGRCHKGIHINENQVNSHALSQVERMNAVVRMYEAIASHEDAGRVESFCPFVSNGRADQEWSHMIMRDPECYRVLGAWLNSKDHS